MDADTLTKQRRNIDIEMVDLYEDPIEMNFIKKYRYHIDKVRYIAKRDGLETLLMLISNRQFKDLGPVNFSAVQPIW